MLKIYGILVILTVARVRGMTDLTHLCKDVAENNNVTHPFDCQAYIDCSAIPQIRYCDNGLHFDGERKVCDMPEVVKCQLSNEVAQQFVSPFIAIDTESGKSTQPLYKFNPNHVECVHFGAYFLPHPQLCNQYYICAYGHLHKHSCGRGTLWNFEREQCESAEHVNCYANALRHITSNEDAADHNTTAVYEATVCYPIYTTQLASSRSTPNFATSTVAVSSISHHSTTTTSNFHSSSASAPKATRTTITLTSTGSTVNVDGNKNMHSNTPPTPATPYQPTPPNPQKTIVTPSVQLPVASTKRDIVDCPNTRQSYLIHPKDCSKYFICILGKAVLTSCPHGLYWDHKAESCDLAENVNCTIT